MAGEDCIFCGIVAGKIPCIKVFEDPGHLAFLDINPRNPGHTLVIPKRHYEVVMDMPEAEAGKLFELVKRMSVNIKNGTKADGISIMQNNYKIAGQVVPHVHFHVIPRFAAEGPPSLESILPVKKMPEEILRKIADNIKAGGPQQASGPHGTAPQKKKSSDEFDF